MKLKKFTLISSLLISLLAFAVPVPQEELNNVNNFIALLLQRNNTNTEVKVEHAEREEDGSLSAIALSAQFEDSIKLGSSIFLKDDKINFSLSLAGNIKDIAGEEDMDQIVLEAKEELNEYAQKINSKGFYKAVVTLNEDGRNSTLKFRMTPVSPEAISINLFEAVVKFNKLTGDVAGSIDVSMNATSELVNLGQMALTNIFNSLAKGESPQDSDIESLFIVIAEIFKSIDDE